MSWPPGVSDFKAKFFREFVYGEGLDSITENDISRAFDESTSLFNQSLFDTESEQKNALLYLVAHLMVVNIQTAGGLSARPLGKGWRNDGGGVAVSKGVGQINVTYQVPPPRVAESPTLLYYFQTTFGQRYMQLLTPRLIGNMAVVCGPDANWPAGGPQ